MYMLLDDTMRIQSISRNVQKFLKVTPLIVYENYVYIHDFNSALKVLKDFVTEEFVTLTIPEQYIKNQQSKTEH